MSSSAVSWALYEAPGCDPTARLVLLHLAEHADKYGRGAFPSAPTIAEDIEVSLRVVRRHLKALEDSGLICRGDQRLVSHISADRRPVVWDLSLSIKRLPKEDRRDVSPTTPRRSPRRVAHDTPRPDARVIPYDRDGVTPEVVRGDARGRNGVTPASPKPSTEPRTEPPPPAHGRQADHGGGGGGGGGTLDALQVLQVLATVGTAWQRPTETIAVLGSAVAAAIGAGWPPDALAQHLAADPPPRIRKPSALLRRRVVDLPTGPQVCDCTGCAAWRRRTTPMPARAVCLEHRVELLARGICPSCRADQIAGTA